ncbi:50S ribosomal protein L19 [Candidatus Aerophobetes bacterium]|uniref:Large ribosomal subunit protein bL19 n=1 Tax=Aerophobetes bacterium TaxID=2030807 RepID=A0A2A4YHH0_UNCAE|nr:MAG: 50S ribosomal protein L19 [Candidatus Aerophobetes bacterium]
MRVIEEIEEKQLRKDIPHFRVGDTLKVHVKIIEGSKERIQAITGTVIAIKGKGLSETFSLYRIAYGAAMERVFPIHSPRIAKIEVMKHGKVCRSKLYYLRGTFGKKAKVKEQIMTKKKTTPVAAEKEVKQEPVKEAPKPKNTDTDSKNTET